MTYQEQEERLDEMPIPVNADFDFPLFGKAFTLKNAVEGLVLGGFLALPAFLLLKNLKTSGLSLLVYTALTFLGGFLLGNNGINGDTLSRYLLNVLRFRKNKKITYYNPRVKSRKRFFTEETEDDDYVIPRERLEALYRRYLGRKEHENTSSVFEKEDLNDITLYFEDDIEEFGRPEELMSRKARKHHRKTQKKVWKHVEK